MMNEGCYHLITPFLLLAVLAVFGVWKIVDIVRGK